MFRRDLSENFRCVFYPSDFTLGICSKKFMDIIKKGYKGYIFKKIPSTQPWSMLISYGAQVNGGCSAVSLLKV